MFCYIDLSNHDFGNTFPICRGDGFRGVIDKPIHNPKTESSPEIQPKSSVEETEADNEVSQKIDQMSLEVGYCRIKCAGIYHDFVYSS